MTRAFIHHDGTATEMPLAEAALRFGKVDLVWIHIDARDTQAAGWLAAQSDIPAIALAALVAAETRPRSDPIGQGAITNLRGLGKTPQDDPDALSSVRLWTEPGRVFPFAYARHSRLRRWSAISSKG
jgi:zinc transporter